MPQNDLGTAHGQIEISFDNKGIDQATAALKKFEAQAKTMSRSMDNLDKSMRRFESDSSQNSNSLFQMSKAHQEYSSRAIDSDRNTRTLSKSVKLLTKDLQDLKRALQEVDRVNARVDDHGQRRSRVRRGGGGSGVVGGGGGGGGGGGAGGGGALFSGGIAAGAAAKMAAKNLQLQTESLKRMEKQFDKLDATMNSVNKTLKINNAREVNRTVSVKKGTKATKEAEAAMRGYSSSMFDTHKKVRVFRSDTVNLKDDLVDLTTVLNRVAPAAMRAAKIGGFFSMIGGVNLKAKGGNKEFRKRITLSLADVLKERSTTAGTIDSMTKTIFGHALLTGGWIGQKISPKFKSPAPMDLGLGQAIFGRASRFISPKQKILPPKARPRDYIENLGAKASPMSRALGVIGGTGYLSARNKFLGEELSVSAAPKFIQQGKALSVLLKRLALGFTLAGGAMGGMAKGFQLFRKSRLFDDVLNVLKKARSLTAQGTYLANTKFLHRISPMLKSAYESVGLSGNALSVPKQISKASLSARARLRGASIKAQGTMFSPVAPLLHQLSDKIKVGSTVELSDSLTKVVRKAMAGVRLGSIKTSGLNIDRGLADIFKLDKKTFASWLTARKVGLRNLQRSNRKIVDNLKDFSISVGTVATGLALTTNGIKTLWGRFQWFFKIPKPIMAVLSVLGSSVLPSVLKAASSTLKGISNIAAGTVGAVKQISGAFAALPGAVTMFAATITSVVSVFGGLKDKLKDVFDDTDPEKAAKAFDALPEHLKPVATALKGFVSQWRGMQTLLQQQAFRGVEQQIKMLGETYIPILGRGMGNVISALQSSKNLLLDFLMVQRTQKDVGRIYQNTAAGVLSINRALTPTLAGLRDMAVVGSGALVQMDSWASVLAESFRNWAQVGRETGSMDRMIKQSFESTVDLTSGLKQAAIGLYELLTLFKTTKSLNPLKDFSDGMQKFSTWAKNSKISGSLANIRRSLIDMGGSKLEAAKNIFDTIKTAAERSQPFIKKWSDTFSSTFGHEMKVSVAVIGGVVKLFDMIGASSIFGAIAGYGVALKILPKVWAALGDVTRATVGWIMVLKDAGKVVAFADAAFLRLGTGIAKVGGFFGKENFITRLGEGIGTFNFKASRMASILVGIARGASIAFVGFAALMGLYQSGKSSTDAFNNSMEALREGAKRSSIELRKAFMEDRGLKGKNVLSSIRDGVDENIRGLEDLAKKGPGITEHISDKFFGKGSLFEQVGAVFTSNGKSTWSKIGDVFTGNQDTKGFFEDTDELNQRQDQVNKAQHIVDKLKELKGKGVDFGSLLGGSDANFQSRISSIKAMGTEYSQVVDFFIEQRNRISETNRHFETLTPAGLEVSAGFDKIAESAGNLESKLNGLESVLRGLGLLQKDAVQDEIDYYQSLNNFGDSVSEALANSKDASKAFDPLTGKLNTQSDAAAKLKSVFDDLGQNFRTMATDGSDVGKMFSELSPQVDKAVSAINAGGGNITREGLLGILKTQQGLDPSYLSNILQTGDGSFEAKKISELFVSLQRNFDDKSITVPIEFESNEQASKFDQFLQNSVFSGTDLFDIKDGNLVIKAGVEIDPNTLARVAAEGKKSGLNLNIPGGLPDISPEAINLPPGMPTPIGGPSKVVPGMPGMPGMPAPIVAGETPPKALKPAPPGSNGSPKLAIPPGFSAVPDDIKMPSTAPTKSALESLQGTAEKIDGAKTAFEGYSETVQKAMSDAKDGVTSFADGSASALNQAAQDAKAAGEKFGEAYAEGIENKSIVARVAAAAANLANTVKGFFHQSPPKRGPLSAHGDAARYGGGMFVRSYAGGMSASAYLAAHAAGDMAGGVYGGISGISNGFGMFGLNSGGLSGGLDQVLNQTQRVVQFMSDFVGVVQQIGQSLLQLGRVISDPEGKGTFFGKRNFVRDKNVTDKQLADKRADEAYAATHNGNIPNQEDKEEKAALKGTAKGRPTSANQTIAAGQPTNRQVAQMIYNRAVDQGYSNSDAMAIVAAAQGVSGLNTGKGIFGTPSSTTGLRGGDAAADQVTEFLQQMYQAQSGNIYARIREVGRQNGVDFTDIRRNEPDARILVSPVDHDTGLTTTGQGTKSGRGRRKNVPVTDSLGNTVSSGETTSGVIDRERPGENLDISDELQNSINQALSPLTGVQETNEHLQKIQNAIDQQNELDTPASRATAQGLEGIKSSVLSNKGMTEEQNPIDQMSQGFTSAGNIAQNVFGAIQSGLNAIGGVKELGDMLVRGMSSTDDIVNAVTQVQKFIDFGAKIASTVGSIADLAGQIGSASPEFGGAAQAVSAISSAISGAMQGVNAAIDLAKEGWEIFGSYFGQFLGSLAGGVNQLQGNVRFLLDAKAGQLLAYSADNPNYKTAHGIPGVAPSLGPNGGNTIGQINMYSGPGSDPRDDTRNMLFQVQSAQLQGALAS